MNIKEEPPFNYHKCSWCLFRTKSLGVILSHFKKHRQEPKSNLFFCETANLEAFECHFCNFENNFKLVLDRHVSLVHGEDQHPNPEIELKRYICGKCDFETYSLLVFARHFCNGFQSNAPILKNITKLNDGEKGDISSSWFKCAQCSFKTKYKGSLKTHFKLHHQDPNDVKSFQCKECSFKTKNKGNLKVHVVGKHVDLDKMKWIQCEQCPFKAKLRNDLKTHMLWEHLDPKEVKWFHCEQCSFKTKTNSNLKVHILRKHQDVNEVNCEQGSFKTIGNFNLKEHILWRWKQLIR